MPDNSFHSLSKDAQNGSESAPSHTNDAPDIIHDHMRQKVRDLLNHAQNEPLPEYPVIEAKIVFWNQGSGYGFVMVQGKRAFLHVNAFRNDMERGVDLKNQTCLVDPTSLEETYKGWQVRGAYYTKQDYEEYKESIHSQYREIRERVAKKYRHILSLPADWSISEYHNWWSLETPNGYKQVIDETFDLQSALAADERKKQDNLKQAEKKRLQQLHDAQVAEIITAINRRIEESDDIVEEAIHPVVKNVKEYYAITASNEKVHEIARESVPHHYPPEVEILPKHYYQVELRKETHTDSLGRRGVYRVEVTSVDTGRQELSPDERGYRAISEERVHRRLLEGEDILSKLETEKSEAELAAQMALDAANQETLDRYIRNRIAAIIQSITSDVTSEVQDPKVLEDLKEYMQGTYFKAEKNVHKEINDRILQRAKNVDPYDADIMKADIAAFRAFREDHPVVLCRKDDVPLLYATAFAPKVYDEASGKKAFPLFISDRYDASGVFRVSWTRSEALSQETAPEKTLQIPESEANSVVDEAWRVFQKQNPSQNLRYGVDWYEVPEKRVYYGDCVPESMLSRSRSQKLYEASAFFAYPVAVHKDEQTFQLVWFRDQRTARSEQQKALEISKRVLAEQISEMKEKSALLPKSESRQSQFVSLEAVLDSVSMEEVTKAFVALKKLRNVIDEKISILEAKKQEMRYLHSEKSVEPEVVEMPIVDDTPSVPADISALESLRAKFGGQEQKRKKQ